MPRSSTGSSWVSTRSPSPEPIHPNEITLKIGNEYEFVMSVHTRGEKIMSEYCKLINVDLGTVRFMYDNKRLRPTDTPLSLMMEDGDEISVALE